MNLNFGMITAEEFREYAEGSPYKSFMQTPEIAELREKQGWVAYYLAAWEGDLDGDDESGDRGGTRLMQSEGGDDESSDRGDEGKVREKAKSKIKAAAMVVAKPTFLGKAMFFCPGGPLMDYEDAEVVEFFMRKLKGFARTHNGFVLKIDPYYEVVERDRHGAAVDGGFDHAAAVEALRKVGFHEVASDQPKYMFALELGGETPEELMTQFKANTRNHIRKAEKMGVRVRELTRAELPVLKRITEATSERRGFSDRPLSYYEQMYDLFYDRGEVKFLVAEAVVDGGARDEDACDESVCDGSERDGGDAENKGASDATTEVTPLSAAMFMLYGDEVVYLFSGSDEQYMRDYNAQYAIQWEMIRQATEQGYARYNFYGIHGLPEEGATDGIYDFKKGFTSEANGRVIELIGTYEVEVDPVFYGLHEVMARVKKMVSAVRAKK